MVSTLGLLTFGGLPSPLRLFEDAFASWPDIDRDALRQHRVEVLEALVQPRGESLVNELGARDPRRLAILYAMLVEDDDPHPADPSIPDTTFEDVDRLIGAAFADVLIRRLPRRLTDFERVFESAPRIGSKERDHLSLQTSVVAGGAAAAGLVSYGLTPVDVAESARMVSNLAARWLRARGSSAGDAVRIRTSEGPEDGSVLSVDDLVEELDFMSDFDRKTCERLVAWLLEVSRVTPLIFNGFEAVERDADIELLRTSADVGDPQTAWSGRVADDSVA